MGANAGGFDLFRSHIRCTEISHGFDTVRHVRISAFVDESVRSQGQKNVMDGLSAGRFYGRNSS